MGAQEEEEEMITLIWLLSGAIITAIVFYRERESVKDMDMAERVFVAALGTALGPATVVLLFLSWVGW